MDIDMTAFLRLMFSRVEEYGVGDFTWFYTLKNYRNKTHIHYRSYKRWDYEFLPCERWGAIETVDKNIDRIENFLEYLENGQFLFAKLEHIYAYYKYEYVDWENHLTSETIYPDRYNKVVDIFNKRVEALEKVFKLFYENKDKNIGRTMYFDTGLIGDIIYSDFLDFLSDCYYRYEDSSYCGVFTDLIDELKIIEGTIIEKAKYLSELPYDVLLRLKKENELPSDLMSRVDKYINEKIQEKETEDRNEDTNINYKYSAKYRIEGIKKAIREVQKDGLKIGITEDGKLYVENTSYTKTHCNDEGGFGYAEIECFSD
ncbi:hypothetical protein ACSW9O_15715 (plasmid) [Clostridium perfringens]|uniref:hypothetical protein n=1 Tax=Clostridium perfringens TaxID=1502 RepID=UPI00096A527A|nr:hypothetical protein [Clostridium perfringens]EGT3606845.1 hypothetical protein [Clostridium perfringens]